MNKASNKVAIDTASSNEQESKPDRQTDLISEFLHELKTRLMAVTAACELMARDQLEEHQRELLTMVQKETMRLSRVAQDFLEMARMDAGRLSYERQPVDLVTLLEEIVALYKPQAEAKNVSFEYVAPEQNATILGDHERLKKVLTNLIGNAMKYIEEGGRVELAGRVTPDEVAITVTDDGPGIDTESLPHIFDRFYRVPDSEGFTEGSGLGLSIASKIAQEHDGRIEVTSEVGVGSAFTCYLPREKGS